MSDYNRYIFNQAQLRAYIEAVTGESVVVVKGGSGGSTHLPTKIVTLDVGSFNAQDVAAHEAEHIMKSSETAGRAVYTEAERLMLNALEDARMERQSFRDRPGLRPQYQENLYDKIVPLILDEPWLLQAIKGIIFVTVGYTFPRGKFKAKARKILAAYEAAGLHWEVRNAPTEDDLLPILPRVLALFNEKAPERKPQPQTDEARPEPPPVPEGHNADGPDGDCTHCDELDRRERAEAKGKGESAESAEDGESGGFGEDESDEDGESGEDGEAGQPDGDGEEGSGSRDAISYDVDEAAAEAEAARRLGQTTESKGTAPTVNGQDEATGGPTVNRLMDRARKLKKDFDRLDQAGNRLAHNEAVEAYDSGAAIVSQSQDKGAGKAVATDMPEAAKAHVDIDAAVKATNGQRVIDHTSLFSKAASGALGYAGTSLRITDSRMSQAPYGDKAEAINAQFAGLSNYLGRQLQVFLQSQNREGVRHFERRGTLDSRRAYQMGGGRFDVYKYPPNPDETKPLVVLTVDLSSSMGGTHQMAPSNSLHAMMATMVMGGALARIGVPFEVHGFGGWQQTVFKTFDQPWGTKAVRAMSNICVRGGGGTPAAEGLAFAWVRALTRPETRRIVIQVTDGAVPQNAKKMVKAIGIDGGTVIGVGIGAGTRIEKTFPDGFTVQQSSELPNQFARLLKRLTLQGKLR